LNDIFACEGAPRDQGLDQGRASGALLRARFAERTPWQRLVFRAGLADAPCRELARGIARHFPHQAETQAGLAVGAGVPAAWLGAELAAELQRETAAQALAVACSGGEVGRALDGPWLLRRSRPEGLFASLELTRPWLTHSLVGVNERGLAVAVVGGGEPARGVPGALLGQDCLERFQALDAALEWCEGRPGGGGAVVLIADASGDAAAIEIGSGQRRVLRPEAGVVVVGGTESDATELSKRLTQDTARGGEALARALPGAAVVALGGERRLLAGGESFSL
jgi:hypothetical protein